MKYLVIYWIWIDYTISIIIKKFGLCNFTKKHLNKFFIQMSINVLKKTFCWKFTFIWKMTRIMLEAFASKFILYVYQNIKWNQKQIAPTIYPKKKTFSCLKQPPHSMLSPMYICFFKGFCLFVCLWRSIIEGLCLFIFLWSFVFESLCLSHYVYMFIFESMYVCMFVFLKTCICLSP
jgi:hypothetical protein